MQRFVFTFFFVILCLGQGEAYAQQNSAPPDAPIPAITEQNERPAQKSNGEADRTENQTKEQSSPRTKMNGEEVSVVSSADKIAKNANIISIVQAVFGFLTLILAGLATWFAWGAWRAGKEGVDITRKAAKAEYQPYIISLHDSFGMTRYSPDQSNTVINFVGEFDIKNIGRTPASNIKVAAEIKYVAKSYGESRNFQEEGIITNWRFGDLYPNEWRTFKLNFSLSFPDGDAKDFMNIREMDIWIRVTFSDLFMQTRCQELHFLVEDMVTGAHLQGAKEIEQA